MGIITDKDVTICGHGSGTPSTKNLHTYSSSRYSQKASNGKDKGVVAVRRFKNLTDAARTKFHDTYATILGRNNYSQSLRAYVYKKYSNGKYYSDCSSSGIATFEKMGAKFEWYLNTAGIYTDDDYFEDVDVKIQNGHIMNPEVLEVADAILYRGNDPARPKQIGHVEWVYAVPAKETPAPTTPKKKKKGYSGKWPELPDRGYFRKGDGYSGWEFLKDDIKLMQKVVNWVTGDKIKVDGKFGNVTLASVKRCQKFIGTKADGKFGPKTLEAVKAYKK